MPSTAEQAALGPSTSVAGPSESVFDSASMTEGISIVPDGGVTKQILQEGSGDVPPLHALCLGAITQQHHPVVAITFYFQSVEVV